VPPVRRTAIELADGRELVYYDATAPYASGEATRTMIDTRAFPDPQPPPGTMRFDVLSGEWVAIAAHRMDRTHLPPADLCPLCPAKPGREPGEIPAEDYEVVVFQNRFPSFAGEPDEGPTAVDGEVIWPVRSAHGRCEVICFTSDHDASFAGLGVERARTVVEVWADRTAELSALRGVEEVFVFENRGPEIGVTLHHPHGQIYAYPYVTPRTTVMLEQAERYAARTGGHLLTDLLEAERRAGTRVVLSGEHWTAYVPAAARWPVEVHLAPHRDVPDLAALDDDERDELAGLYLDLLGRLDRFFPEVDRLPYVAGWHQAPVHDRRELGRLHLRVFSVLRAPGKLKYLAGSESGAGAWVNDTTPEQIADRLREVGV
jgi:UDPglucose--hexose-1-phosphate uridylyltransferase